MTAARVFTEHDLASMFVLGLAIGLLVAGLAALAFLTARDIDRATTLPAPDAPADLAGDATERITPLPVHDLRRPRTTFEEMA